MNHVHSTPIRYYLFNNFGTSVSCHPLCKLPVKHHPTSRPPDLLICENVFSETKSPNWCSNLDLEAKIGVNICAFHFALFAWQRPYVITVNASDSLFSDTGRVYYFLSDVPWVHYYFQSGQLFVVFDSIVTSIRECRSFY